MAFLTAPGEVMTEASVARVVRASQCFFFEKNGMDGFPEAKYLGKL